MNVCVLKVVSRCAALSEDSNQTVLKVIQGHKPNNLEVKICLRCYLGCLICAYSKGAIFRWSHQTNSEKTQTILFHKKKLSIGKYLVWICLIVCLLQWNSTLSLYFCHRQQTSKLHKWSVDKIPFFIECSNQFVALQWPKQSFRCSSED